MLTPDQKLDRIAQMCQEVTGSAGTRLFNFADSILDVIAGPDHRMVMIEHTVVEMFARDFGIDTRPPTDWHWLCSCGTRKDGIHEQTEAIQSWRAHKENPDG